MEKLPEKWFIVRTDENRNVVNHWITKKTGSNYFAGGCAIYSEPVNMYDYNHVDAPGKIGYIEITFEDFKRLVLKENSEVTYPIFN